MHSREAALTASTNTAHITRTAATMDSAVTRAGHQSPLLYTSKLHLAYLRKHYELAQQIDLTVEPDLLVPDWTNLQRRVITDYTDRIKWLPANRDMKDAMAHAAIAGAGVMAAYAEVCPRVAAWANDSTPDFSQLMRQSLGGIMHWAALSSSADAGVTYGVSRPKPNLAASHEDVYTGLRFDPQWFALIDGRVGLRAERVTELRDERGRPVDSAARGTDVYFGCPARQLLPAIYRSITNVALQNGLVEQSFSDERAYIESGA